MFFNKNNSNDKKFIEELKKQSDLILKYELEEGILERDENGKLVHTNLESLNIDPNIFNGLEDIF